VNEENELFVSPALVEKIPISVGATSLIRITAPAAVGKSTTAREIAYRSRCPIWDLAGRRVAQNSFAGGILRSFPTKEAGRILEMLHSGNFLLVLDSLEESEQLSGERSFEEFLKDICEDLKAPRLQPAIIILTRAETTLITLYFEEHNVPYAHYALDFFTESESHDFINRRLDQKWKSVWKKPHRVQQRRFREARDEVFQRITASIDPDADNPWRNEEVRRFVGYAPVLEAISEFLTVRNYRELVTELRETMDGLNGDTQFSVWNLLNRIVRGLLLREQQKCILSLRERFGDRAEKLGGEQQLDSLYSPEEQILRVSGKVFGEDVGAQVMSACPAELREELDETISSWFEKHPFLVEGTRNFANKVFEEYVHAKILSDAKSTLVDRARSKLRAPEYLPNQMFGHFLLLFCTRNGEPILNAEDIGFFYEALASQLMDEAEIDLQIMTEGEGNDPLTGVFGVVTISGEAENAIAFSIDGMDRGLHFNRRLANATIEVPGVVELGVAGHSFTLGPAVDVECEDLLVMAEDVWAVAHPDNDVILRSISCLYDSNLKVRKRGIGKLAVSWLPKVIHPWSDYKLVEEVDPELSSELVETYRQMCKILRVFRSRNYGELGKYQKHIHKKVRNSKLGKKVLSCMIEDGILRRQASLYIVDSERLGKLGLNRDDVKYRRLVAGVRSFLQDCLGT